MDKIHTVNRYTAKTKEDIAAVIFNYKNQDYHSFTKLVEDMLVNYLDDNLKVAEITHESDQKAFRIQEFKLDQIRKLLNNKYLFAGTLKDEIRKLL